MNTYFKFLSRNKFYTFVTVFGFAVSLMFVFLIAVYVKQELSVDNFHEKKDRIYVLGNETYVGTADRIFFHIKDRYPEIETAVPVATQVINQPITIDQNKIQVKGILANDDFFHVFSFPLVEGNPDEVLKTRNGAVVSESFARKVYSGKDPIGQMIHFNDSVDVVVSGVMKDIRNSTIPYADILVHIDNSKYFNGSMGDDNFSNAGSTETFILVKPGADLLAKKAEMEAYFREAWWMFRDGRVKDVRFIPFKGLYFSETDSWGLLQKGNKSFVLVLMSVGFIILLFAIFNYINLTVAQTSFRAREMATRNLVGANRRESFWRLIIESGFLILVSLAIGILLAFLCVPYANDLLGTELHLAQFFSATNVAILLLLVIILGVVAGTFPGYLISRFKSIDVVKGTFKMKNRMVFSKIFIVIQNVLTIVLIAVTIIIARQINYMISAPLGYNNKNIIVLNNNIGGYNDFQPLVNELDKLASVKRHAFSLGTPFNRGSNNSFVFDERNISLQIIGGDTTFFDMMGFQILIDNQLAATGEQKCFFNERAYNELNIKDNDVSIFLPNFQNVNIAGKIRDFQLGNIIGNSGPVMLPLLDITQNYWIWHLLVEVQGDPAMAYKQVKEVFEQVTQLPFEGKFMEDQIAESFAAQQRLLKIVTVFCVIAILISMLGLMAISTYFIRQRVKEIALRKVLGSNNLQIMSQLVLSFLLYVGIAFIVATPVIWYLMKKWLEDYSYRITLSPVYFIIAGLFCLVISFFTVFFQSYLAAIANPVEAIKNE